MTNLTNALAAGQPLASLREALTDREYRRDALRAKLAQLDAVARLPRPDAITLTDELHRRLGEWRDVLMGEPVLARQIVRRLIAHRLRFDPDPVKGVYRFTGKASYGRLLAGVLPVAKLMVPPG